jgi:predicted DNA-binding protein
MAHRTQITLTDEQYDRLKREARRTGASLSELIRQAVDARYAGTVDDWEAALDAAFGLWADRVLDPVEYVQRLRGQGLGHRLGV